MTWVHEDLCIDRFKKTVSLEAVKPQWFKTIVSFILARVVIASEAKQSLLNCKSISITPLYFR